MVVEGVTEIDPIGNTAPTELSITPLPPVKFQLKLALEPVVMIETSAMKLLMEGAAITVTVTVAVLVVPATFVADNV